MKPKHALLGLFLVCQFSAVSSQAATLSWDSNGTGASVIDGGGTWTTANNWYNGTTNVSWSDGNKDTAAFGNIGTTPQGVAANVTATATVGGLIFNPYYAINAKYNLTGGTLTFSAATGSPTVVMNTHPSRPFAAINSIMAGTQGFDLSISSGGIFEIGT